MPSVRVSKKVKEPDPEPMFFISPMDQYIATLTGHCFIVEAGEKFMVPGNAEVQAAVRRAGCFPETEPRNIPIRPSPVRGLHEDTEKVIFEVFDEMLEEPNKEEFTPATQAPKVPVVLARVKAKGVDLGSLHNKRRDDLWAKYLSQKDFNK